MLAGRLRCVASVALLAEYRSVLLRPRLCARHSLSEADVDRVIERLAENAILSDPMGDGPAAPDRGDDHLWALLAAEPGLLLVTGDAALLAARKFRGRIVTPEAFVRMLRMSANR